MLSKGAAVGFLVRHPVKKRGPGTDADSALGTPPGDPVQEGDQSAVPPFDLTILMAEANMPARKRRRASSAAQISVVRPHAAAIDIGAQFHVVAVGAERDAEPVRTFRSFTKELHELADWLKQVGIHTVAMESTGVYWHSGVRDPGGARFRGGPRQRLQKLHSYGLLRASFRPSQDVATLRSYLRQRERLLEYAASHIQHMQKAPTLMNVQLHQVVEDVTGATGMRIIRAIVAGERNADDLARYRDVRCKLCRNHPRLADRPLSGRARVRAHAGTRALRFLPNPGRTM